MQSQQLASAQEVQQIAALLDGAGLGGLQPGDMVASMGPGPCCVEHSAHSAHNAGELRGRLPTNLALQVLELRLREIAGATGT